MFPLDYIIGSKSSRILIQVVGSLDTEPSIEEVQDRLNEAVREWLDDRPPR